MSEENEKTHEVEEDVEGTDEARDEIRFKRSHFYAALVPIAFVVGLAAGFVFWGQDSVTQPQPIVAQAPPPTQQPQLPANQPAVAPDPAQVRLEIEVDDDAALGPPDAPITIVEFSDFNCPYCQRFHVETFPSLMETYPDQIHFVYRDFPVVGGLESALASECAHEQDGYWEYHNLLFSGTQAPGTEGYLAYAEELGLDAEAFEACLTEGRYADEVEADAMYAAGLGITGTPTFFINGIPLVGAQPLEVFIEIIEAELEG
jgi:protein-disulfide isomerase